MHLIPVVIRVIATGVGILPCSTVVRALFLVRRVTAHYNVSVSYLHSYILVCSSVYVRESPQSGLVARD